MSICHSSLVRETHVVHKEFHEMLTSKLIVNIENSVRNVSTTCRVCCPRRWQSRVGFLPAFVCFSIFLHDVLKTDAARITKLDIEMLHRVTW